MLTPPTPNWVRGWKEHLISVGRSLGLVCFLMAYAGCLGALNAQGGGILDWLHRMSGPGPFLRAGPTYLASDAAVRVRLTGLAGVSLESTSIFILTGQPTVGVLVGPLELSTGIGLNLFLDENAANPLFKVSVPLQGAIHVRANIALGGGVNLWRFSAGDFADLGSDPVQGTEAVWNVFILLGR